MNRQERASREEEVRDNHQGENRASNTEVHVQRRNGRRANLDKGTHDSRGGRELCTAHSIEHILGITEGGSR